MTQDPSPIPPSSSQPRKNVALAVLWFGVGVGVCVIALFVLPPVFRNIARRNGTQATAEIGVNPGALKPIAASLTRLHAMIQREARVESWELLRTSAEDQAAAFFDAAPDAKGIDHVRVVPAPNENVFFLHVRGCPTPAMAAAVANALAESVVRAFTKVNRDRLAVALGFQEQRRNNLTEELEIVGRELAKLDYPDLELIQEQISRNVAIMDALAVEQVALDSRCRRTKAAHDDFTQVVDGKKLEEDVGLVTRVEAHPRLVALLLQKDMLTVEMAQSTGPDDPRYISAREKSVTLNLLIANTRKDLLQSLALAQNIEYLGAEAKARVALASNNKRQAAVRERLAVLRGEKEHVVELVAKKKLTMRYYTEATKSVIDFRARMDDPPMWVASPAQ